MVANDTKNYDESTIIKSHHYSRALEPLMSKEGLSEPSTKDHDDQSDIQVCLMAFW